MQTLASQHNTGKHARSSEQNKSVCSAGTRDAFSHETRALTWFPGLSAFTTAAAAPGCTCSVCMLCACAGVVCGTICHLLASLGSCCSAVGERNRKHVMRGTGNTWCHVWEQSAKLTPQPQSNQQSFVSHSLWCDERQIFCREVLGCGGGVGVGGPSILQLPHNAKQDHFRGKIRSFDVQQSRKFCWWNSPVFMLQERLNRLQ